MSIANWNAITQYKVGDKVLDATIEYTATNDSLGSPPPSNDWSLDSITGVAALNTLTGDLTISSSDASISVGTSGSTINLTASIPAPVFPAGTVIQQGTVTFLNQAQTITYPRPFTTAPSVFISMTGNSAGINGYMWVGTYGSLTSFYLFYSGPSPAQYGGIPTFWMAIGT